MTTNQTHIISKEDTPDSTTGELLSVNTAVNDFITTQMALGCINFEVRQVAVTPQFLAEVPAVPTGNNYYTVQVNYYNPALY